MLCPVPVSEMVFMCALPVRRAHRERADRGDERVVRAAMRAVMWGSSPFSLAMGSWQRRHWGSLPPWETFFKVFFKLIADFHESESRSLHGVCAAC